MKTFKELTEVTDKSIKARERKFAKEKAISDETSVANGHYNNFKTHYKKWNDHYIDTGKSHPDHLRMALAFHNALSNRVDKMKETNHPLHKKFENMLKNNQDVRGDIRRMELIHNS